MEWSKKIEKHAKKENSASGGHPFTIMKKLKPVMPPKNIKPNTFGSMHYATRKLTQVALLDAERRKAEVLTLIRRASFI